MGGKYTDTFGESEAARLMVFNKLTRQEIDIPPISERIYELFRNNDFLYGLDVGCGEGSFTKQFLQSLEKKGFVVYLHCIDSSEEMVRRASEQLAHKGNRVSVYHSKFEEFGAGDYDFFTAFHSLYGISPDALEKFYHILRPGGRGFFVISDESSCELEIQRLVFPDLPDAQKIMKKLDELGIACEYSVLEVSCYQNVLIRDDRLTESGILIAEFLHHEPLTEERSAAVKEILYRNSVDGQITISKHDIIEIAR